MIDDRCASCGHDEADHAYKAFCQGDEGRCPCLRYRSVAEWEAAEQAEPPGCNDSIRMEFP